MAHPRFKNEYGGEYVLYHQPSGYVRLGLPSIDPTSLIPSTALLVLTKLNSKSVECLLTPWLDKNFISVKIRVSNAPKKEC